VTAASQDTLEQADPGQQAVVIDAIRDAITSGDFAPNQRLVEAELSERFGASRAMHPGRPGVSLPQHLEIIEALCDADPEAAEAAVRRHLRSVIEALPEVDKARSRRFDAI
jgi:DNA-binding GntR family transcriptional regulator